VPRLHREITLESARLRRTPRPPRPPQGSPSYGSSAPAPARRYPTAALIGPRVNARPGSLGRFWVVNHTVGSRLEKRRVSNQVTARPPPPPTTHRPPFPVLYGRNTRCMVHRHGAWGMERRRPPCAGVPLPCRAGAIIDVVLFASPSTFLPSCLAS
jgi:hypothetical protein